MPVAGQTLSGTASERTNAAGQVQRGRRWLLLLLAASCGGSGQTLAAWGSSWWAVAGVVALFAAGGLALARVDRARREPPGLEEPGGGAIVPSSPLPLVPISIAILLGVLAASHTDVPFSRLQVAAHLGALAVFVGSAAWRDRAAARPGRWITSADALALVLLGGLALGLRLWRLADIPPIVWDDEILYLEDALSLHGEEWPSPHAGGHWGAPLIHAYLIGAGTFVLDRVIALRLVSVIAGALSVALLYLLVRDLFDRRFAVVAALLMAVSAWSLIQSRHGYVWAMSIFAEMVALAFLVRGLRSGRLLPFAVSGVGVGLAVAYTYAPALTPVVFVLFALYLFVIRRPLVWARWGGMVLLVLTALVFAAPRYATYFAHADTRDYHRGTWIGFEAEAFPLRAVLELLWQTALAFNHRADTWEVFLPRASAPVLDPVTAAAFGLGLFWALFSWRRTGAMLLLLTFVLMLIPPALTYTITDWATVWRACGTVPALFGLAAAPFAIAVEAAARGARRAVVAGLLSPLLALAAFVNLHAYFVRHPEKAGWHGGRAAMYWQGAERVVSASPSTRVLVTESLDGPYVRGLAGGVRPYEVFFWPDDGILPALAAGPEPTLVVARTWRLWQDDVAAGDALAQTLEHYYPLGTREDSFGSDGQPMIVTYRLEPDAIGEAHGLAEIPPGAGDEAGWTSLGGTLIVPADGQYRLDAAGLEGADIRLDGVRFVPGFLSAGLHEIAVRGRRTGEIALLWSRDGGESEPIPLSQLLRRGLPAWGLRQTVVAPGGSWRRWQPVLWRQDPERPSGLDAAAAVEWEGDFFVSEPGHYVLAARTSAPTSAWVDGEPIFEGLAAWPELHHPELDLEAGWHRLRTRSEPPVGRLDLQIIWVPPSGNPFVLGGAATRPPGDGG